MWGSGAVVAFGEAGNDVFRPGLYGIRGSGLTLDGGDGHDICRNVDRSNGCEA